MGRDFLETKDAHISFSQKGEMYLELKQILSQLEK